MKRPSPQKRLYARLIILAALFALAWFVWHRQQQATPIIQTPPSKETQQGPSQTNPKVPEYVQEVLFYIRIKGHEPDGFVGGREFQNREKRLPIKTPDGKTIRYSEWDVHPKEKGKSRGPERLVTGSDKSAYYTKDHYKTFLKIE